ncbi:hypothetical protein GCM10011516_17320 [Sphingobacterium cellulitidis]|uniref:Uncharacterized protein n=2 Tax=Sphingobacterium cellulitidis TaxID=1768011 RepID=A0A8H9FYJ9_9SPHI|nr:hypothetical protein GCM10011516_17320 [Sphingobacterium soli]
MKIIQCSSCQSKMTLNSQGFNRLNQLFIQCPYCSSEFWMGFDENMNLRAISNPKLTEEIPVKIEGDISDKEEDIPVKDENIPLEIEDSILPQTADHITDEVEKNIIADQDLTANKKNLSNLEVIIIIVFIFCALYLLFNY